MRILAVGILAVTLFVTACGQGDTDDAVSDAYGTGRADASGSVATSVTVASTEITAGAGSSGVDASGLSCDNERFLDGDFDGDGIGDRAFYDESSSSVVICSAGGTHAFGVGQLEILIVSDVDRDGRDELLAGATTAWGQGVELVALVDGRLDFVLDPTGEALTLWQGLPPDRVLASGCGSFTASGDREIAVVEGTVDETGAVTWQRTIFRLDGHRALEVSRDTGSFVSSGSPDPITDPALQELIGNPC